MIQDILRVMKLEGSKVQNNLELPRKKKKSPLLFLALVPVQRWL